MKKVISSISAIFFASVLSAATVYIGSDGSFYDKVEGGSITSYTSGDSVGWQTNVSTWNVNSTIDLSNATFIASSEKTINVGANGNLTTGSWLKTWTKINVNVSEGGSFSHTVPATYGSEIGTVSVSGTNENVSNVVFIRDSTKNVYVSVLLDINEYASVDMSKFFASVQSGSEISANSTFKALVLQQYGKITINADAKSIVLGNNHINAMDNFHMILNTATPFSENPTLDVCRSSAKIELHTDIDFGRLQFTQTYNQTLTLDLNGYDISFTSETNNVGMAGADKLGSSAKIIIEDFTNDSVRIGTIAGLATNEDGSLKNVVAKIDKEEVALFQDENGWLYIPEVPEPAEWAMIFGAIALGFVAYRRRK